MGNLFADIRIPIVAGGHEAFDGVSRPNTDCDAHNVGTVYPNCTIRHYYLGIPLIGYVRANI